MKTKTLFYQIPKTIINDTRLNTTDKLVFMLLYDRKRVNQAYNLGSYADISHVKLCRELNICEFIVNASLHKLKDTGYIVNVKKSMCMDNKYYLADIDDKMYIRFFKSLLSENRMSRIDKLNYCIMYDLYVNRIEKYKLNNNKYYNDMSVSISNAELMNMFNKSYWQTKKYINTLVKLGLIEVEKTKDIKVKKYRVVAPVHLETVININTSMIDKVSAIITDTVDTVETVATETIETITDTVNDTVETVKESIKHSADRLNENINSSIVNGGTVSAVINSSTSTIAAFDEIEFNKSMDYFRKKTKETDNLYNKYLNGIKWS